MSVNILHITLLLCAFSILPGFEPHENLEGQVNQVNYMTDRQGYTIPFFSAVHGRLFRDKKPAGHAMQETGPVENLLQTGIAEYNSHQPESIINVLPGRPEKARIEKVKLDFEKIVVNRDSLVMKGNRWSVMDAWGDELHTYYSDNNNICYSFSPDNGQTWETEVLIPGKKINHVGEMARATFNAALKTDSKGTVHLFFTENRFYTSPSRVWHYSRQRGQKKWKKEIVDEHQEENDLMIGFDIDLFIDKKDRFHLVYNVGEKFTRYAFNNGDGWERSDIHAGVRPYGCAVVADEYHAYVSIGAFMSGLFVAERKIGDRDWNLQQVFSSVTWETDIALTDGALMVTFSEGSSGVKGFHMAIKKPGREWKIRTFGNEYTGDRNRYNGNILWTRIKADPQGRVHMVFYLRHREAGTGNALCYMYSDDNGDSWREQFLAPDVAGYIETGIPDVCWNSQYLFLAYKCVPEQPALLRVKYNQ